MAASKNNFVLAILLSAFMAAITSCVPWMADKDRTEIEVHSRFYEPGSPTQEFTVNGVSFAMVRIPAGDFTRGSPEDEPGRHPDEVRDIVRLSRDYWMGETQVTQGLWKAVMGRNPSFFINCGDDCPVERVSWDEAQAFILRLNRLLPGGNFRMPTEAEWEYASRAGSITALYSGPINIIGERNSPELELIAWYGGNSCANYKGGFNCSDWKETRYTCETCGTQPVKHKKPNAWGLYDMMGNVWEWCQDWYDAYQPDPDPDPEGPLVGSDRVVRGCSWSSMAKDCRSARRVRLTPGHGGNGVGLRLAGGDD